MQIGFYAGQVFPSFSQPLFLSLSLSLSLFLSLSLSLPLSLSLSPSLHVIDDLTTSAKRALDQS